MQFAQYRPNATLGPITDYRSAHLSARHQTDSRGAAVAVPVRQDYASSANSFALTKHACEGGGSGKNGGLVVLTDQRFCNYRHLLASLPKSPAGKCVHDF